jgi:ABC-type multidrug transport system ATPase subunit
LVLDEPTSGLDSFKATGIAHLLHKLARNYGKTIIASIHQPSSEAFAFFDKLFLISDGHIVFQGTAMRCQKYFFKLGCPLEKFKNPADSLMKILSVNYPKTPADEEKIKKFVDSYKLKILPRVLKERESIKFDELSYKIDNHKTVKISFCR